MELLLPCSSTNFHPKHLIINRQPHRNRIPSLKFINGCSLSSQISLHSRRIAVVVAAKKKENNYKKDDTHSFVAKPDEAGGFFPEAVLLKEKKVQEDGQVLPEFADSEEMELFEYLNLQLQSDMDVLQMRHYEVVYIIHEQHEEEVNDVNNKVQEFFRENKGKVWRFSDWGMRRLAYKIQKAKNGHYILMNIELEGKLINEFKSMLDKDERVIRHLVMKMDEAITEDCPPPPEFHTLRPSMYDTDDEYDDDEDEEYDEEEEVEEEDDDDSVMMANNDKRDDESSTNTSKIERKNLKPEKVGR